MFAYRHRFHGRTSLRSVYQSGQTVRGPQLTLRFSQRDSKRPYRVAVVVSRKVHKSAVTRNRIRRRLYEAIRQSGVTLPGGLDLVITVYSEQIATLPAAKLQTNVNQLLQAVSRKLS